MNKLEQEIEDLKKQVAEKEAVRKLQKEKHRLECKLKGICPTCGGKDNCHGSPCTDGMW